MEHEDYLTKEYERVWNNFEFNFKIFATDLSFQKKICDNALKKLDDLRNKQIKYFGGCSINLYRYYRKQIMKNYNRIR